ncbi:type I restriction-modification system methyltransferase subunit, partial [Acidovorax temperans]
DWGDLCDEDRSENDYAVTRRLRILSCYRLVDAERLAATPRDKRSSLPALWIITEADRSVTTLLRPDEY